MVIDWKRDAFCTRCGETHSATGRKTSDEELHREAKRALAVVMAKQESGNSTGEIIA